MTTFADVEILVSSWLRNRFAVTVQTETDADLESNLPAIKVERVGGIDTYPGVDRARLDVECFAATRFDASGLADRVRSAVLYELPGTMSAGGTVLGVTTVLGPTALPAYSNPAVRRFLATYEFVVHATH